MADAVAVMDTYVPGCPDGSVVTRTAGVARLRAAGNGVKAVLQLVANRQALRAARTLGLEDVTAGDCPHGYRTFTGSYTHASGTDTGSLIFADYCTVDGDGDGEETTINRTLNYVDAGQPTDFGLRGPSSGPVRPLAACVSSPARGTTSP